MHFIWPTGNETVFGRKHISSPLTRFSTWNIIDKFDVVYSDVFQDILYLENCQVLFGRNKLDILYSTMHS